MPAVTARQAAVSALVKVNTQGAYSNLVLNETLKKSGLSPADSSFASRLFYGTLERFDCDIRGINFIDIINQIGK